MKLYVYAILILLLMATAAHAQTYLTIGAGQANLKSVNADNLWQQQGFAHIEYQQTPTYKLGLGYKLKPWLSAEVDYRNLGNYSATALWVSDSGQSGHYSPQTRSCINACEQTSFAGIHGRTDGIGLSLVAAPDWTIAPMLRVGAFYYRSSFDVDLVFGTSGAYQHNIARLDTDGHSSFNSQGITPIVGAGVRAGWFEIEYTYFSKVGGDVNPYQAVSTITAAVRVPF